MAPKVRLAVEKSRKCVNAECEFHGRVGSMVRTGKSGKNAYFQCRKCKKGYSERYGTLFYRKRVKAEEITQVLKALAEGNSIRGSERLFGHHRDTIIRWLKEAGRHCESVEKALVGQFKFNHVQIDEFWTFIGKKTTRSRALNRRT